MLNSFDFYDPHLSLKIINFLKPLGIYDSKSLESAFTAYSKKIESTKNTKSLDSLKKTTKPLLDILRNDSQLLSLIKSNQTSNAIAHLNSKVTNVSQGFSDLYELGLLEYNMGKYKEASDILYHFRLMANPSLVSSSLILKAHWGKLASDILSDSIEYGFTDLNTLVQEIESQASSTPSAMLLTQRAWVSHWALFVYFKHPNGKEALLDLFTKPTYLNAIQMVCPWLTRYLVVVLVLTFRKNTKEISRILSCCDEQTISSDPILSFYDSLYCNLDLEKAGSQLKKINLAHDYFLVNLHENFILAARQSFLEILLKIYSHSTLEQVGKFLNLPVQDVGDWISCHSPIEFVKVQDSVFNVRKGLSEEGVASKLDALLKRSVAFGALLEKNDPLTV